MEIKKSSKANLENKKLLFTEIGLIIALAAVYFAFDWSTAEKQVSVFEGRRSVAGIRGNDQYSQKRVLRYVCIDQQPALLRTFHQDPFRHTL